MLHKLLQILRNSCWWHEASREAELLTHLLFIIINWEAVPIITPGNNVHVQFLQIEIKAIHSIIFANITCGFQLFLDVRVQNFRELNILKHDLTMNQLVVTKSELKQLDILYLRLQRKICMIE